MLDRRLLQRNPEIVEDSLKRRKTALSVNDFTELDTERRSILTELETLKNERNTTSAKIAELKKAGEDASSLVDSMGSVNENIKKLDTQLSGVDEKLNSWMLSVPNLLHESVPMGKDDSENQEVRRWGKIPEFSFKPKEHWELGPALGGLDFERGAKLTGARFTVYWHWAARLERALVNFFLDVQTKENGYVEIIPPYMVNRQTMTGTGQLPKFSEDLFKLEDWEYFLIPTSEVPLTNMHAEEVLPEEALPLAFTSQTPCFRSEAGSYGKDTRGIVRLHQFTKVEMVRYALPDDSFNQLELMTSHAEDLLQRLEIPYRVVVLCTGDIGFAATKTYDLEVWLPGQNTYREISSCSNCLDFQARRANIRYKPKGGGKTEYLHTLNGSGLAVGRAMVAVMENGQQEDGSIVIPEALIPYMDGKKVIKPGDYPAFK